MPYFVTWDQRNDQGGFVVAENESFNSPEAAEAAARSRGLDYPWQIVQAENPRQAALLAAGVPGPPGENQR
jgi:hypothetical protein